MCYKPIIYQGSKIKLHKAILNPNFNSKTILVNNPWDYIQMWLKRKNFEEALFYWEQAKYFFNASVSLPKVSSPLTAYYCFLNATKCLLCVKHNNILNTERLQHGVYGKSINNESTLCNEKITFDNSGILFELCQYLKEEVNKDQYTLKQILYNLPYIHRAYFLSFPSSIELFIPIENPLFVQKNNSEESWFCAEIKDEKYQNEDIINNLPQGWEKDPCISDKFVIRKKKRFKWKEDLDIFQKYYKKIRKKTFYIYGNRRLWYLKKDQSVDDFIDRSSLTLTFAAMHRLSELSRYQPMLLAKHFNSEHNWLLSEFISTSLYQFIDEISSEITGEEFMMPGIRL